MMELKDEILEAIIEECAKRIKACTGVKGKGDYVIRWKIEHAAFRELQSLRKGIEQAVEEIEEKIRLWKYMPTGRREAAYEDVIDILEKHLPKE